MASYAIGDLHGCYHSLMALLQEIGYRADADRLLFLGDIVNRGPHSLKLLRWLKDREANAAMVLGNHDIHAIASASSIRKHKSKDSLSELWQADDCEAIIEWLRQRPVFLQEGEFKLVHAGLNPHWDIAQCQLLADKIQAAMTSASYLELLSNLYQLRSNQELETQDGQHDLALALRTFSSIRICTPAGEALWKFSSPADELPDGYLPWYKAWHMQNSSSDACLVFGHWAAHGYFESPNVYCLDSGCAWGNRLTALRLDDRASFSVAHQD